MPNSPLETFIVEAQNKYTNELIFVPGEFALSNMEAVPYFTAVMPLQDLVNQIKLVEDIPDEALLDWSLEELFQRDISWDRVETELVNRYLNNPAKLSFFNSLTIALLPQNGFAIEECYGEPDSKLSSDKGDRWERKDVGNICVEYLTDAGIGIIRWHKDRIFPVAIDGQHRLAALKAYYEEKKDTLMPGSPELKTKISLIFLILDERVGFKRNTEKPILETLREIFIDLNKNARNVPKSRLILLEDQNIQSLCVRTLLPKKAKISSPSVLPLPMVTWRSDEAKFDSGYSVTSVLNLNEIVSYCLNRASLEAIDPLEEKQIKQYIDKITAKLDLEQNVKKSIIDRSQLCIDRTEPFSFTEKHLNAFQDAFRQQWAPHIIRVFKEFSPYKKYLLKAGEIGAIDKMLADYLLLPVEKRGKFEERKKTDNKNFNPHLEIKEPLKELENIKTNEWAFQVVFQKALFINLFELEPQKESLFDLRFDSRNEFLTWWIVQMNDLHEQGVFSLHWKAEKGNADLWLGIANNPGSGSIQHSQAAANRISSFITICMYFKHIGTPEEINNFVNDLIDEKEELPRIVQNAFRTIKNGLVSLIKAKANADEIEDIKKLNKRIKQEIVKRLKAIQA